MLGGLVEEEVSKYSGKRESKKGEIMEVWEQDDRELYRAENGWGEL